MRLAFVIYGGLHLTSGGFRYDRELVAALRAGGDEVDVVALPWRGYARALLSNLERWPFDPERYDAVIEDELVHPAVLVRQRRLRQARVPLVSLVHNLASRQPRTRARALVAACERAYLRSVDGVVAVCASTRDDVWALAGVGLPATVACAGRDSVDDAPGAAEDLVVARAHLAGPLRILFVGAVNPHKGLHRLLPVLAALPAEVVRLDVAGSTTSDSGYVGDVRRQIARLGLEARVRLHGELDAASLRQRYRDSHLLVLPSDREAYPLAGLEALAFGLPLLLTDAGGTAELLGAGDPSAGALLAPDDRGAWIAALAGFAHDRDRLVAASHAALRRHRAHGLWSDTAAVVRAFVRDLIAARARGTRARSSM